MIPITKNIIVVDEQGINYEATYPKRAKGLVKNGRARFIEENKICLACPPNNNLEDNKMLDNIDIKQLDDEQSITEKINKYTSSNEKLSMDYILGQIEKIATQSEYLNQTIQKLGEMADADHIAGMSSGNKLGAAQAQALGDVVHSRETTNQQLLKLYEKMYDDLKTQPKVPRFEEIGNWLKTLNKDEFSPESWSAIHDSVKVQLSRPW